MIPPPSSMYFLLVSPFVAGFFSATHETFAFKGIENILAVNIRLLVLPMAGSEITIYSYNGIKNMY